MPRLTLALVAIAAAFAGAFAASLALRPAGLDETGVRSVVESLLAEREAAQPEVAAIDQSTIDPLIENYLVSNPRIMERVAGLLDAENARIAAEEVRLALAASEEQIYNDPGSVVLGNPDGDVTLVEMFDYNCTYCRGAMPDLAALLDEDPNLKVILKEFPILSDASVAAARIAVAVSKTDADYWAFHETLFTGRGQVTGETALDAAEAQGLSRVALALDAESQAVTDVLERSYSLARALKVTGTPTYIIGEEIIAGAVGLDALKQKIANMRACGKTVCAG